MMHQKLTYDEKQEQLYYRKTGIQKIDGAMAEFCDQSILTS